jgi:hypothetical protein
MFEYTHEVKGQDGFSWGVFPNESIAKIIMMSFQGSSIHITSFI